MKPFSGGSCSFQKKEEKKKKYKMKITNAPLKKPTWIKIAHNLLSYCVNRSFRMLEKKLHPDTH